MSIHKYITHTHHTYITHMYVSHTLLTYTQTHTHTYRFAGRATKVVEEKQLEYDEVLCRIFDKLDLNKNGTVTRKELIGAIRRDHTVT